MLDDFSLSAVKKMLIFWQIGAKKCHFECVIWRRQRSTTSTGRHDPGLSSETDRILYYRKNREQNEKKGCCNCRTSVLLEQAVSPSDCDEGTLISSSDVSHILLCRKALCLYYQSMKRMHIRVN
jgi:hypothetical protein